MLHAQNRLAKGLIERAGNRWPQTTAKFAFRVFTRIPRPRGGKPNGRMPDTMRPVTLQTPSGTVATWSLPAPAPAGRKALLVHGWNSRSAHLLSLAKAYADEHGALDAAARDDLIDYMRARLFLGWQSTAKRAAGSSMSLFERYLTVWVGLCIIVGIALGHWFQARFPWPYEQVMRALNRAFDRTLSAQEDA